MSPTLHLNDTWLRNRVAEQGIAGSLNHRLAAGFPVERQAAQALSLRVTGAAAASPLRSRPSPP